MADRQFTFAVLLRGFDFVSAPLRRVVGTINDVEAASRRARSLGVLAGDVRRFSDGAARFGALTVGAGAGLGFALGLTQVPGQAIAAEHSLISLGNTAKLSQSQIAEAQQQLRVLSQQTNQYQQELITGLGVLTASGLDFKTAMAALPIIARTATAEVASISDLANASFALISNMKVQSSELAGVLDMLASAGQQGRFELRDMAQHFDALTASASMLGMQGAPSVLSLAASLQIARRGAGDAATAANNFKNFVGKLASPEVQRNFAKFGVSVKEEIAGALRRGEDPILHMIQVIQRLTQGDSFRIGELMADQQAQDFVKPMLKNVELFKRIKEEAAKGGVIQKDFANIMKSTVEQAKLLRINMAATAMPYLAGPMSAFKGLLTTINEHPGLQKMLLFATVGLVGLGGGALALSLLTRGVATYITTVSIGIRVLSGLRAGVLGMQTVWAADQVMQMRSAAVGSFLAATWTRMTMGLRALTATTWAWTTALLANPIGAVIVGVAALAGVTVLLWRNWDRVTRFIRTNPLFSGIVAMISPVLAMLTYNVALVKKLMSIDLSDAGRRMMETLADGMRALVDKPVAVVRWVATKMRALLPFSPAKEGPLRDLHRVRIMETIASTMQPWPMVEAMRRAAMLTAAAALLPAGAGASIPTGRAGPSPIGDAITRVGSSGGSGGVTIHYAPVIHLAPGTPAETAGEVRRVLDADRDELRRMVRDAVAADRHRDERKAQR